MGDPVADSKTPAFIALGLAVVGIIIVLLSATANCQVAIHPTGDVLDGRRVPHIARLFAIHRWQSIRNSSSSDED